MSLLREPLVPPIMARQPTYWPSPAGSQGIGSAWLVMLDDVGYALEPVKDLDGCAGMGNVTNVCRLN